MAITDYRGKDIVEVMSYATGQLTYFLIFWE